MPTEHRPSSRFVDPQVETSEDLLASLNCRIFTQLALSSLLFIGFLGYLSGVYVASRQADYDASIQTLKTQNTFSNLQADLFRAESKLIDAGLMKNNRFEALPQIKVKGDRPN